VASFAEGDKRSFTGAERPQRLVSKLQFLHERWTIMQIANIAKPNIL
jgi:hypothetical protein